MKQNLDRETYYQLKEALHGKSIRVGGRNLVAHVNRYAEGGRAAIRLATVDGEPYYTASVNGDFKLYEGEVAIKNWSENTGVAQALEDSGILVPTGRTVSCGYVNAPVFRLASISVPANVLQRLGASASPVGIAPKSGQCMLCATPLKATDIDHSICNVCWEEKVKEEKA